jgi:hypothetical protein
MAIEAGLIWRAIFVFIGIRFTFSFGKFFSVLQNFSKSELLQWITRGHGISRKRKHLSRLSAAARSDNRCKKRTPRRPEKFPGDGAVRS